VNTFALPKNLIIFGIVIPITLLLGYVLSDPGQIMSVGVVFVVLSILSIPVLLKHNYPILIFSWNFPLIIGVLPGQPSLWIIMAFASLFFTILAYVMDKSYKIQHVPSLTWPLLFLVLVAGVTAKLTGGVGLQALGGSVVGGKKFFYMGIAILGYFAISSRHIPKEMVSRYTGFYYLSGLFSVVSNLAYMAGPAMWWLFYFFPTDTVIDQAREDFFGTFSEAKFGRLTGLAFACQIVANYVIIRYGLKGIFNLRRPWRMLLLAACIILSTLGGFRSSLVMIGLVFAIQFMLEGLYRTRLLLVFGLVTVIAASLIIPFASNLPLSMQRSLSFLPIDIDPAAAANARASLEWRQDMWRFLTPEIPKYFWIGKGYAIDATDLYLTQESIIRGLAQGYENAAVAGDYHSGPLSVIIPLGIFGVIGLLWFWIAALRWLYRCYRDGPDYLKIINTFFLSYFIARIIFFIFGFGSLWSDMAMFTGLVGMSVALNGVRQEEKLTRQNPEVQVSSQHVLSPF
jgi:hypothetical protein